MGQKESLMGLGMPGELAVKLAQPESLEFESGSVSAPSVSFNGDADTGLFRPAANELSLVTNGANRIRVTSGGFVSVGSTAPQNEFEVVGENSPRMTIRAKTESLTNLAELGFHVSENVSNASANTLALIRAIPTQVDPSALKADLSFSTNSGDVVTEVVRYDSAGNVGVGVFSNLSKLTINGPIAIKAVTSVNAANYTVLDTDAAIRFNTTACTVTLPTPASFPGRILHMNVISAVAITSASSNVKPRTSDTAGTAILAAAAGNWAMLQSDGSSWVILAGS